MKKTLFLTVILLILILSVSCKNTDSDAKSKTETSEGTVYGTGSSETDSVSGETGKAPTKEDDIEMNNLIIYPEFPDKIRRIYDYDVTVTAEDRTEKLPVYNHVVESNVSRRPGVDMYRRFSMFAFSDCSVRVDIKVKTDFTSYTVFPSAKNFKHSFKDGVISVYLDEPDYFGIQLDDDQNTILSVFADAPETDVPKKCDNGVIYIDGWVEPKGGLMTVETEGTTIYIAPGAVLNARLKVKASNCKIIGRGAIVDPFENLFEYDIRAGGKEWNAAHMIDILWTPENCVVDGIVVLDAHTYNFLCYGEGHKIRNLKELSAMMTSDGIAIKGRSTAEHCWLYVGDNGIVTGDETGFEVRDITVGTTCAAIFPQGNCNNLLFDDINVFRADEGVINNYWNPNKEQYSFDNIVFRRLAAVEMPDGINHFLQTRNYGVAPKTFTFEDISIPVFAETIRYDNSERYIETSNYTLDFKNLVIGGKLVTKASELNVYNPANVKNTEKVTADASFTGVKRNEVTVNYTAKNKIFVGSRQVFLSNNANKENGKFMFPTKEICDALRVSKISDAEFVSEDELISAKVADSVKVRGDSIYIAPSYKGGNILLPEEGEISRFAEQTCYQVFLTSNKDINNPVYTVYANPNSKSANAGISRRITDEIQTFGDGEYRLTFSAKASAAGLMKLSLEIDDKIEKFVFSVKEDWSDFSFDLSIKSSDLEATKCVFFITPNEVVFDDFSLRDFVLTKVD